MTAAQDRAETYLRLRAEAELRRVQALPRPDPPSPPGLPEPLRGAARAVLPLGRRAVAAVQPLAQNVARSLEPVAGRVIGTALPAADEAARRLHPLAWQAAGRLQSLQWSGERRVLLWRWQVRRATASFRGTAGEPGVRREEVTAEDGVRRFRLVTHSLVEAGAVDPGTAESVVEDLTIALAARSRIAAPMLVMTGRPDPRTGAMAAPPAGPYRVVPVGELVPAAPKSGLSGVRVYALVIAPDRASRPAITVVLTDGYTPWPDEPPRGMRVVVGLIGDEAPEARTWARAVRVPAG